MKKSEGARFKTMNFSREDYLKTIYKMSKDKGYVNNKDLAESLGVSRTSVSEMSRKLKAKDLVSIDKGRIKLSAKGDALAKDIISRHRIWEYFLFNNLGLAGKKAHDEAELLEHVTSDELKDALNKYLGYPKQSPRGNIIYDNNEES
ncbi:metal-dependent transcriptional regulator [Anaerococcus sp. AGMB09787]|uniref:metal-dependent transcriptional regulator n=1 Tax=Anaerococcus sp. AGMB09787 TaxID=2922869 RepID=UPI001FAED589|nr:metal-dependent transcriptional regulator [Anaerococcus sp. AGMB09787]